MQLRTFEKNFSLSLGSLLEPDDKPGGRNIETLRHCRRSGVFIVNFEHISHLFLVFLLLNLNK